MSEVFYQQQPTAIWNSVRGVWEKQGMANLLCEHWALFSETWPTSGMTLNGMVFELPMRARPTIVLESSSLPTPTVSDVYTANLASTQQKDGSLHSVTLAQVFHVSMHDEPIETFLAREERSSTGQLGKSLGVALRMEMFPTPTTRDYKDGTAEHERNGVVQTDTVARAVFNSGEVSAQSWGKFEPAIRRWEQVLGRPAPTPTNPDGKDGNHRLSSKFTEWMMGLPDGWITDTGLTRNDELKACGNGVVPQQAEMALRTLLEGVKF